MAAATNPTAASRISVNRCLGIFLTPFLSLRQNALDLLLKRSGGLAALESPHLFAGFIEQDVGRRAYTTVLAGKLFSGTFPHVFTHDRKFCAVLFLEPIHDGLHLFADFSVVGVKIKHTGAYSFTARAGTDLGQKKDAANDEEHHSTDDERYSDPFHIGLPISTGC